MFFPRTIFAFKLLTFWKKRQKGTRKLRRAEKGKLCWDSYQQKKKRKTSRDITVTFIFTKREIPLTHESFGWVKILGG